MERVLKLEGKSKEEVAHILKSALTAGKAVTAGTDSDNSLRKYFGMVTERTPDDFFRLHEFAILGFTPDSHGGKVLIRNPWGLKNGTTEGTISMSLEKYMKNFGDVTVQQ